MKWISCVVLVILCIPLSGFDYFGNEIDYWKERSATDPPPKSKSKTGFDWKKYQDPKNKEFFKEGDHVPPEPFMELARDPSDENIKQWFAYIDKKNQLMAALQDRMQEYLKANQSAKPEEKQVLKDQIANLAASKIDHKRFRFRMYFDSSCPHCKSMMKTMKEANDKGFYVEVKQIDSGRPSYEIPFITLKAEGKELKEKKISATPTLFIADTKLKQIYRVNGYLNFKALLNILRSK